MLLLSELRVYIANNTDGSWGAWAYPGGASFGAGTNTVANVKTPNVFAAVGPPPGTAFNQDATHNCPNWSATGGPVLPEVFGCTDAFANHAARSQHTGGVHVAMADGAVKWASESIDAQLWLNLCKIADRTPISDF